MSLQTDGMGNIVKFLVGNFFELFAFGSELLVDLDRLLGHILVSFLGSAGENKIGAGRNALVTVRI